MRNITFLIVALMCSVMMQAQIFNAGFENNNGTPLSEFKMINNDSLEVPPYAEVPEFSTEAWIQFYDGPDNKIAFSTSFYGADGQSDDWLITPSIEIPDSDTPTLYWKAKSYDFENMESYEVLVSVSDNEMESFQDTLVSVVDEQAFDFNDRSVDLSAYKGQNIYIAFINRTNSGYYLAIDDLYISKTADCMLPNLNGLEVSELDENGFILSWDATENISEYDIGLTTFDTPVSSSGIQTETTKSFTDLEPGTRYQLFLKNADCGSGWTSPKSVRTAAVPPYAYDFEETEENFGEYDSDGWESASWLNAYGGDRAQSGEGYIFNNTSTSYDKEDWIFSPAIKVVEGEELSIKFYTKMGGEVPDPATLKVSVASGPAQTENIEILKSIEVETGDYQEVIATFIPEETGVYYFGFGNLTPQVSLEGPLRIDNIEFTSEEMSTDSPLENHLSVYPNPVEHSLYIEPSDEIDKVEIFNVDGRLINSTKSTSKIDFTGLSAGIYFVKLFQGTDFEVKKVIKK